MQDLIYDLGSNNGDDTGFYLAKGFRVVAIEADLELCDAISKRFPDEVAAERLVVLNAAISKTAGEATFYVNEFKEWSSLVGRSKATSRFSHKVVTVPAVTLASVLERHGAPYYLKIDIEGGEKDAITSLLDSPVRPNFVSIEMNADTDELVMALTGAGYQRFTLVRQGTDFLDAPISPAMEGNFAPAKFKNSMSGLFGRELRTPWQDPATFASELDSARRQILERREQNVPEGWFDIHARRD